MQDANRNDTAGPATGRSSVERLPATLREDVDAAIESGATINEVAARIRAGGGTCSRSAVGRYVKKRRGMLRRRREIDRLVENYLRPPGEHTEDHRSRVTMDIVRTQIVSTIADLGTHDEPMSLADLNRLALTLLRIESTEMLRIELERKRAELAKLRQSSTRKRGLSAETTAAIFEAIAGPEDPP